MTNTATTQSWWPSPWGAEDELGMLNHITPASRVAALQLVREGRLYDLGRVLDEHVPTFPGRAFHQTLVTTAHHQNMGGVGSNRVNWITEVISGTTQLTSRSGSRSCFCSRAWRSISRGCAGTCCA